MNMHEQALRRTMGAGLLFLSLLFSGCAVSDMEPVSREPTKRIVFPVPVTIKTVGSKGEMEEETFQEPPQRIVAVWQNSIETLLALGAGDRIVAGMGVPGRDYIKEEYRPMYDRIPYKSLENLDVESVMMMRPDLIVGWYSTFSAKVLRSTDFWHERGVHTYISPASFGGTPHKTVDLECEGIRQLGMITGKTDKAEAIVEEMRREIHTVTEKVKAARLHRRGLIIEMQGNTLTVYGEQTLAGDILRQVGGELLLPDARQISIEQLLEMNPDAIFVIVVESDYGREKEILERLYHNEALRTMKAVQEERIYAVPLYAVYSSGVRTLDGIQCMAKGLYPELYENS